MPTTHNSTHRPGFRERELWIAVLLMVVRDVTDPNLYGLQECRDACSWVGTSPSRDFRRVCHMAGLDPDAVHPRLIRLAISNEDQRETKRHKINATRRAPIVASRLSCPGALECARVAQAHQSLNASLHPHHDLNKTEGIY